MDIQNNEIKEKLDAITNIIKEPVHGAELYTPEMIKALYLRVNEIISNFEITEYSSPSYILKIINNYVKSTVEIRREYFDALSGLSDDFPESEKIYRTAYSALVKKSSMCAGFAEATRILLAMYNIKSYTLIAKLPETHKKLSHYVCVAEINDDNNNYKYVVLDPERQANCERKGKNYSEYAENMTYCIPNENWYNNKIGPTGVGLEINDYLSDLSVPRCIGTQNIYKLIEKMKGLGVIGDEEK